MHDGRFEHLKQVIEHYRSGNAYQNSGDKRLKNAAKLTSNQKIELIAFLKTLTDRSFLFNPDFRNPLP
jgi:cytochrome c peroxidase